MQIENVTENSVVTGSDGGRSSANLNYILFLFGFVTVITTVIGVALAYSNRKDAVEPFKSHLNWQIRIFWRGVVIAVLNVLVYLVATVIGIVTGGLGLILLLLPVGIGLYWFVWTLMAILKGMKALGRGEAVSG